MNPWVHQQKDKESDDVAELEDHPSQCSKLGNGQIPPAMWRVNL